MMPLIGNLFILLKKKEELKGGQKYLDESNLVGNIKGIDISGELDVGLLVTIGAR
jgi:hypothetical protein